MRSRECFVGLSAIIFMLSTTLSVMNKLFRIIIISVLLACNKGQKTRVISSFPNGNKEIVHTYANH